MKILIFGTGKYYQRYKKWFSFFDIVAFVDNNSLKQNTLLNGIPVISLKKALQLRYDGIFLVSVYENDMKNQLFNYGVVNNVIYNRERWQKEISERCKNYKMEIFSLNGGLDYIVSFHKNTILLMTPELTLTGGPTTLLNVAKVLLRNKYHIVIASAEDGVMKDDFLELGIPVIIDERIMFSSMEDLKWTRLFAMIFLNTIFFSRFLSKRDVAIPILWWLHEMEQGYSNIETDRLSQINRNNLQIFGVGKLAIQAYKRFFLNNEIECLLYGVEDFFYEKIKKKDHKSKIVFAAIGSLYKIKAQDILIQAIKSLSVNKRRKAEFLLIGNAESEYAREIKEVAKNIIEVKILGELKRNELLGLYKEIDVVVCPSRMDTMPTVLVEAMMNCKTVIVSKKTGIAEYIFDKKNGLLCQPEDIVGLRNQIEWCLDNQEKLPQIGKLGRKIYDEKFSMKIFEKNLLGIVEKIKDNKK